MFDSSNDKDENPISIYSVLEILKADGTTANACPVNLAGKLSGEWYQYFGETIFTPADQMLVSFSILPSAIGMTDISLDEEGGRSSYDIQFANGLVKNLYSYNPGQWNTIEALFDYGTRLYTLTINGQVAGTFPFDFNDARSVAAVRVHTETIEEDPDTGEAIRAQNTWLDTISVYKISGGSRTPLYGATFDDKTYSSVSLTPPSAALPAPCVPAPTTWSVTPTELNYEAKQLQGAPAAQQILIGKNGPNPVTWTLSENIPWLKTDQLSGTAPATLTVTVDHSGLEPGEYAGTITLTPTSQIQGSAQTVSVNLLVNEPDPPILMVNPKALFLVAEKRQLEPEAELTITSGSATSADWTLDESIDWLSVDQGVGVSPATVKLLVDSTNLDVGIYTGTITVNSANALDSPQTIDVNLEVKPVQNHDTILLETTGGVNNIWLDWEPADSPKVKSYRVFRAEEGSSAYQQVADITDTMFLDSSLELQDGIRYCYTVEAIGPKDSLLGFSDPACAQFSSLTLTVGDVWAGPNQEAIIPLQIGNATGLRIAAGDIWLKLDCAVVTPLEVTSAQLTRGYTWNYHIHQDGDSCTVKIAAMALQTEPLFGRGAMFWLKVAVKQIDPTESPMEIQPFVLGTGGTEIYAADRFDTPVELTTNNGTLHLSQFHRLGDLNGNGIAQAIDAYIALKIASGEIQPVDWQRYCGDVNGDGKISAADASMIMIYATTGVWPMQVAASALTASALTTMEPVKLSLTNGMAKPGMTTRITLKAENLSNLAGTDLLITYDPNIIAGISQVETVGIGQNFSLEYQDDSAGKLRVSLANDSGIQGSGELLRLTVNINPNAPNGSRTILALAQARLNDPYGQDFVTSALQGNVVRTNGVVVADDYRIYLPQIINR